MQQVSIVSEKAQAITTEPRAIVAGQVTYEVAEWLGDRGCSVTVAACGLSVIALPGPLHRAIIEPGEHHWEYFIAFFNEDGEGTGILDLIWDVDACETRLFVHQES